MVGHKLEFKNFLKEQTLLLTFNIMFFIIIYSDMRYNNFPREIP